MSTIRCTTRCTSIVFWRCLWLLPALLLAGCAGMAPPSAVPAGNALPPVYQTAIDITGRLSVRYQQDQREQGLHGSFSWTQTPQRTHIELRSPLGQIIAVIDVSADGAVLTAANQAPQRAADVDALAQQTLGWPLPVSGLRHWLQGFTQDADGSLRPVPRTAYASTQADGWQLDYADWSATDAAAAAAAHPKRIDLARADGSTGPVAIRVALDGWQVPAH